MPTPSRDEQIQAMLDGKFFDLLKEYIDEEPSADNYRQYITVTRRDMVDFLNRHLQMTNSYFKKFSSENPFNDGAGIAEEWNTYLVFWMDHGRRTSIIRFKSMNEALAEFVFWGHEIYS